jgi:hypothetical protein
VVDYGYILNAEPIDLMTDRIRGIRRRERAVMND